MDILQPGACGNLFSSEVIGVPFFSGQRSKSVKEYLGKLPLSAVIFVCQQAEEHCPRLYPPLVPLCWPFEDPAARQGSEQEQLNKFREVRDLLDDRIRTWLAEHSLAAAT